MQATTIAAAMYTGGNTNHHDHVITCVHFKTDNSAAHTKPTYVNTLNVLAFIKFKDE